MNDDYYNIEEEEQDSGLDGSRGREAWLKRLAGRMGDARIHDSSQAGELARKLGARAFTAGRDIYVQPELLRPFTPESAALLEHELFHVAEQTGMAGAATQEMPLLRPSRGERARRSAQSDSIGSTAMGGMPVVQRYEAGQSSSESRAEGVESNARREQSQRRKQAQKAPPDPEEVADRVYNLLLHELRLENERGVGGF